MPKRTLIDHRPWLVAALLAALIYYALQGGLYPEWWQMLAKGSACLFLSLYALKRSSQRGARILALYLALCAMGDVALMLSFEIGGGLFFAAHMAAITLYLTHPRASTSPSQKGLAATLLIATPVIAYWLAGEWMVMVYACALGAMAASAWMSRFPRYRVGVGAVLFVVSDGLIFAQSGVLADSAAAQYLVWPLYFAGQFLIATGVVQTLRGEHPPQAGA